MIDLCTVVFAEELQSIRLQARSVNLYCKEIGIEKIIVIVNDNSQVDPLWWGSLASKVEIYSRYKLGNQWHENGWVSQQALKMLGAALSANHWCMILDAKTIFIKSLLLAQIINQNKIASGWFPIYPVFSESKKITNRLWNIDLLDQIGPGGVPFLVEPEQTRAMMSDIGKRTGKKFADYFQQQGKLTEFVLYSGWIWYQDGNFDKRYCTTNALNPVNICHSEVKIFGSKFRSMLDPRTLTVSIHRNAWNQLTAAQQEQYITFLASKGIV